MTTLVDWLARTEPTADPTAEPLTDPIADPVPA